MNRSTINYLEKEKIDGTSNNKAREIDLGDDCGDVVVKANDSLSVSFPPLMQRMKLAL